MDDLLLLKLSQLRLSSKTRLIQEIHLPSSINFTYVTQMKALGKGESAHIYIGTENNIYRVPVQSCTDYRTCFSCVQAQDPFCAFDTLSLLCQFRNKSQFSSSHLQDVSTGNTNICGDIDDFLPKIYPITDGVTSSITDNGEGPNGKG